MQFGDTPEPTSLLLNLSLFLGLKVGQRTFFSKLIGIGFLRRDEEGFHVKG